MTREDKSTGSWGIAQHAKYASPKAGQRTFAGTLCEINLATKNAIGCRKQKKIKKNGAQEKIVDKVVIVTFKKGKVCEFFL